MELNNQDLLKVLKHYYYNMNTIKDVAFKNLKTSFNQSLKFFLIDNIITNKRIANTQKEDLKINDNKYNYLIDDFDFIIFDICNKKIKDLQTLNAKYNYYLATLNREIERLEKRENHEKN